MEKHNRILKMVSKELILAALGGVLYVMVELLFRGRSHPSMFILGGLCFVAIGILNERYPWEMPLVSQMVISSIVITVLEFFFGIILNIVLHLHVWDYSNMPYNCLGQICLLFSVGWFFLSLAAIFIDDWIRHEWFGEDKPHYTWFCAKPPNPPFDGI